MHHPVSSPSVACYYLFSNSIRECGEAANEGNIDSMGNKGKWLFSFWGLISIKEMNCSWSVQGDEFWQLYKTHNHQPIPDNGHVHEPRDFPSAPCAPVPTLPRLSPLLAQETHCISFGTANKWTHALPTPCVCFPRSVRWCLIHPWFLHRSAIHSFLPLSSIPFCD